MKWRIILFTLIVLCLTKGYAEYIDNTNSRRDYAYSISSLYKNDYTLYSRSDSDVETQETKYTIVILRMRKGNPSFDQYEPDILVAGPHNCYTAAYSDEEKAIMAIEYLKENPQVCYAELDGEVFSNGVDETIEDVNSGEENQLSEYVFHSSGAAAMGFQTSASWCQKAGTGIVTVAVIDSGVYSHSFIASRLAISGYDYVDSDEDSTNDTFGHGTHVAGIIVDCTPELPVFISPIRVLDNSGKGSKANTTSAIFEAVEMGCDVINMSLVSQTHSEALEDAILFAVNSGSTVVISAGNSGSNTNRYCPVHLEEPGFIVVGACSGTMDNPVREAYSNYGASIDVYAFGSSISSCSLSGGFSVQTGTSQAAPHISALCAILKLLFPDINSEQIENRIKKMSGDGEVNVPDTTLLKPKTMGIGGDLICLPVGTQISLLRNAVPECSFITIEWSCEDETIALIDSSGVLYCLKEGNTILHGNGPANADIEVVLQVVRDNAFLRLPSSIKNIEEEAFFGTSINAIYLNNTIESIDLNAFTGSELKTIFCETNNNIFNVLEDMKNYSVVISADNNIWTDFEKYGISYIIDCMESTK